MNVYTVFLIPSSIPRLPSSIASVDEEWLACDERGAGTAQEDCHLGDIFW